MKIAFTTKGTQWDSKIDPRFGRTEYLLVYDEETDTIKSVDNRAIENEAHGAGPLTAQKLFQLKPDVLITGNGPGGNAAMILSKAKINIFTGAGEMTVKQALEAYRKNKLMLDE